MTGLAVHGAAPTASERTPATGARMTVTIENDFFVGRDEQYTSGAEVNWLAREQQRDTLPAMFRWAAAPEKKHRYGISLGQMMFTPSDVRREIPDPEDRPYAGFLYLSTSLQSSTEQQHTFMDLQLGVVGPEATADSSQKFAHRIFGVTQPAGWDHQLPTEPTAQITFERRRWAPAPYVPLSDRAGLMGHIGGGLGNVATYANAGLTLRFNGAAAARTWGTNLPRPSITQISAQPAGSGDPGARYFFLGIDGRAVARNIFLDGNTFRDSPSVDRKPLVADVFGAAELGFRRFTVTYTVIWRSREFSTQERPHLFGSLSATAPF